MSNGNNSVRNDNRCQIVTINKSFITDGGDGIGIVAVFDTGGDDKISGRLGCVVGIAGIFRHHRGGEVTAVEEVVERVAGRRHYRNVRGLSGLEHGGEGGVLGDDEGEGVVGADGIASSIFPADEAVAAIGSGGDINR